MPTWDDYNKQIVGVPAAAPVATKPAAVKVAPVATKKTTWDDINASAAGTSFQPQQMAKVKTLQAEADTAKALADKKAKSVNFFSKIVEAPGRITFGSEKGPTKVGGVPVPTSIAEVANLPFQAVNAAEKAIGASVPYIAQKITGKGDKSFGELYDQAPTAGRMVADTLTDITAKNRAKRNVPMTTADYFFPELFGQIADAGVTAAILAPLGARVATKYNTETVTPVQMADVVTGRTPKGAPLKPETIDLIKREVMAPGTTKEMIKTAVRNGVEIKTAGPAGPIRQIVGELVGGRSPEEARTEVNVGGKTVPKTTVAAEPSKGILPPKNWEEFNQAPRQLPEEAMPGPKGELTKALTEEWDNNYADEYMQLDTTYNQLREIKKPTEVQLDEMASVAERMLAMEAEFVGKYKGVADEVAPTVPAEQTPVASQPEAPAKPKSVFQKIGSSLAEKEAVPREVYLKKQIDKKVDEFRRGAQIMPTNEGAGVRNYKDDTGKSFSYFKLSRAKGDMARRSEQSKTYAMKELVANDPDFANMVSEYENILNENQIKKQSEPQMEPAFKRAPSKPRGFLASIGAKKSIETKPGSSKAAPATKPEGGFILSERAKAVLTELGIPISEKTLSNRLKGVFKPLSENVRVQSIHDLTTVVHEATHALDKKTDLTKKLMEITGVSKKGNPVYSKNTGDIRKQLTDIYEEMYGDMPMVSRRSHALATRMKEGLATFIENYFYNPAGMEEKYPGLVDAFIKKDGKFHTPEIEQLLTKMNDLADEYAQLNPDERIGARIRRGEEVVKKEKGFNLAQRAEFEIFNRFEPLKRYARQQGVNGSWDDPTVQAFNLLNRNAFVANFYSGEKLPIIKPDGNFEFKTGNVEDYLKLVEGKEKEFEVYLTARRVIANHEKYELAKDEWYSVKEDYENMLKVRADGYAIDNKALKELQKIKDEYERWQSILEKDDFRLQDATATVEKYAEQFKKPEEIYDNINKYLIDWSENTGLLNAETANKYRNDTGYTSWKRYIDDEISSKPVGTMGSSKGKVSSFKERTGSDLDIISPIYNQLVAINEVIGKGLENMVWERVQNLAKKSPEIARRFEEIEATPAVDKDGNISYPQERDPNLIRIFMKGERKFFKPAPEFVAVAKTLKPEEFTPLDTFLRIPASLFTRLTTSANPIWSLGNLTVDQFSALAQTKTGFKPVLDPAKSLKDYITGNELVKDYIALGGKKQSMASYYKVAPEEIPAKIFKRIGGMKKGAKASHVIGKIIDAPINLLETPANVSEIITRFSEYRRAIDEGDDMSTAMYKANEVTIPFQLQGNFWGQGLRKYIKTIPYFNAALQAVYKFGRAARSNPARVATVGAGLLAAALTSAIALMTAASDKQKRLLSEQPARLLSRYLFIPSPNGEDLIRVRIPEQYGSITGMAYLWVISHYGGNESSFKEYLDAMLNGLPDQLNITDPKKMVLSWMPQTLKPTIEVITNTKTYPEVRPIVPDYMKYKKPSERYTTYTSNMGKFLGQLTNSSPAMIDFWIKEQFGAAGNALVTTQLPSNPIYLQEKNYVMAGRSFNNFYDQKDMVDYQYNQLQDFTKGKTKNDPMFSPEEAEEIRRRHSLNDDVADVLSDMRKLAQQKDFEIPDDVKETAYELLKNIDKNSIEKSTELMMKLKNKVYAAQ